MGTKTIITVAAIALTIAFTCSATTWRLDESGQWEQLSQQQRDDYSVAIDRIEGLAEQDKSGELIEAVKQLEKDFPELADDDIQAFLAAEMHYKEGELVKGAEAYEQFLNDYPRSPLFTAAIERQFYAGQEFLRGRRRRFWRIFRIRAYDYGVTVMARISDRMGTAEIALRAEQAIAESYQQRRQYDKAYEKWSQIRTRWPRGEPPREALLGMARNKYAAYKGPEFDASSLISARSFYQSFQIRYSDHAEKLDIAAVIEEIEEEIAYRYYLIAQSYKRSRRPEAAEKYYQKVLEDWPDTRAVELVEKARQKDRKSRSWPIRVVDIIEDWIL